MIIELGYRQKKAAPIAFRMQENTFPEPMSGCHLWVGWGSHGYGVISINRKKHHAHRIAWQLANGPIPNGLHVLHKCDNRCCVNPDHLFLGTNYDNAKDRDRKGRHANTLKTHCKHGHEFTPENTYRRTTGGRECRICSDRWKREHRERQRANRRTTP